MIVIPAAFPYIRRMDSTEPWIRAKAETSIDPQRVESSLTAIAAAWENASENNSENASENLSPQPAFPPLRELIENFAIGENQLLHLLAVSPASAEKIVRDPAALLWLSAQAICDAESGPGKMRGDLERAKSDFSNSLTAKTATFDPQFRALRKTKARESLRIALREIAGLSTLEQTTLEITSLAELCVREVCDGWTAELSQRLGKPATDFSILGMGKLGGEELNYSSDIDVIFFYEEDGALNSRLSNHEFFIRLAQKIMSTFTVSETVGTLFRIDVRLRPEGNAGPLVRSLESMENYYAGYGETWERMALIKARGIAGSEELAYEFSQHLQPFIYPRTLSPDVLDEIASIKARIERDIVGHAELRRNVKLGHGGIREIEFIVQALQLLHGARHAFLQERSTLKVLSALQHLDLIPPEDAAALDAAYRFLRTVEHRLQIENEAQTHTIPENQESVSRLSRSLGFANSDLFQTALEKRTDDVRRIFDRIFRNKNETPAVSIPKRDLTFFQDEKRAEQMLHTLAHGTTEMRISPRTARLFAKLEPLLLDWLRRIANPDSTLARFVRFIERHGIRGLLFELLVSNPKLLELLMKLFDSSGFLTRIVLRRPQLIEEITRDGTLGKQFAVSDFLEALERDDENFPWMKRARVYCRSQILRIALRDLLEFANREEIQKEYSALAEACLIFTQRSLGFENSLTVIAMGKLGGNELSYGCDLDVIFIGESSSEAAAVLKAMTEATDEGILFPVDARLRPEGKSGMLALPLESYERYFTSGRAQTWEAQALTKARPISGPQRAEFLEIAQREWRRFGKLPETTEKIHEMRRRVAAQRGDDLLDFKTARGGLIHLEFFIQSQQMLHDVWAQNSLTAIALLAERGIISEETRDQLRASYLFFRRCEATLRRRDNSSASSLPREEIKQERLARRMGFETRDAFFKAYEKAREAVVAESLKFQV